MSQISVIIPMYNEEKYIGRCLDSLLEQTEKDFEVILIDDGSTDKSKEIAGKYDDKLPLTILEQQHGWPGKARNRWASIAKWDILVFVDADMSFDRRYIAELVKPIVHGDEVWTSHGREYVANEHHPIARAYGIIRLAYNEQQPRWGVFRAIKKDVFLSHEGYDNSRYAFEDDMAEKIGQALYVPEAICYHNNPENLSEIFSHDKWIGESLIAKGMLRTYLHKYRFSVVPFLIVAILIILRCRYLEISFLKLFIALISVLLLIFIAIGLRRAIYERYITHLIYVPIVMVARAAWYFTGMITHLFKKTIKWPWR